MKHISKFNEGIFDIFKNRDTDEDKTKNELVSLLNSDKIKVSDATHPERGYKILYSKAGYWKEVYYKIDKKKLSIYGNVVIRDIRGDLFPMIDELYINGDLYIRDSNITNTNNINISCDDLRMDNVKNFTLNFTSCDDVKLLSCDDFLNKLPKEINSLTITNCRLNGTIEKLSVEFIYNDLNISSNALKTLNGLPNVGGSITANDNKIYNFDGINQSNFSKLRMSGNPINTLRDLLNCIRGNNSKLDVLQDYDPIHPPDKKSSLPILYKDRYILMCDALKISDVLNGDIEKNYDIR